MKTEKQISGLAKIGCFFNNFLNKGAESYNDDEQLFYDILRKSELENPWFTLDNQKFALKQWVELLNSYKISSWLKEYSITDKPKKVGLVLAGNIPLVGFHDVICVVLSGNIPVLKLSSKDRQVLPFILKKWNEFSDGQVVYEIVDKIQHYDAVIATGSNNTARYLEYYFKDTLSIIRKNRTSIAILTGDESDVELQKLSEDIFRYFGLGCRNVTRLFIPRDFPLDRLFENFMKFKEVINHHSYANNYDYNKAIFLLNQDKFWDNNFVMLKEDFQLFSPLSVLNFSRYDTLDEVRSYLDENSENIQCVVAKAELMLNSVNFGEAQSPSLDAYADNVDTMRFLEVI